MSTQQEIESTTIRVAFDTSVMLDRHKRSPDKREQLEALEEIFKMKVSADIGRWHFMYIDAVRREISGVRLDHLERQWEIQDTLLYFDEMICLSKLPFTFPVMIAGKEHKEAIEVFRSISVSRSDSIVLADAAYLKAQFLVTTDMRVIRNRHAVREAQRLYSLTVTSPMEFLSLIPRL